MTHSKRLYWIRALAQTTVPTGPQALHSVETPEGLVTLQALSEEMRKFQEEDFNTALDRFVARFGVDVALVTQPKSSQIQVRATTKAGAQWELRNPDQVQRYPNVIGFFAPESDLERDFDISTYSRQIREGTRKRLTPDEVLLMHNDRLGRLAMDHARQVLGDIAETPAGRAALARIRAFLKAEYPGFQSTVGIPQRADIDAMITELAKAASDPKLRDTEVAKGIREWMRLRETATAEAQKLGNIRSFKTAAAAAHIRAWLRFEAEELIRRYPDFAGVYDRVFSREVDADAPEADLEAILMDARSRTGIAETRELPRSQSPQMSPATIGPQY